MCCTLLAGNAGRKKSPKKSHQGHTMYKSMVDIQSATAEIRRGNRRKRKKEDEEITGRKYNVRICYAGRS